MSWLPGAAVASRSFGSASTGRRYRVPSESRIPWPEKKTTPDVLLRHLPTQPGRAGEDLLAGRGGVGQPLDLDRPE
jgi:hypothetical protein